MSRFISDGLNPRIKIVLHRGSAEMVTLGSQRKRRVTQRKRGDGYTGITEKAEGYTETKTEMFIAFEKAPAGGKTLKSFPFLPTILHSKFSILNSPF
jgi:hypothetical protein